MSWKPASYKIHLLISYSELKVFLLKTTSHKGKTELCLACSRLISGLYGMWSFMKMFSSILFYSPCTVALLQPTKLAVWTYLPVLILCASWIILSLTNSTVRRTSRTTAGSASWGCRVSIWTREPSSCLKRIFCHWIGEVSHLDGTMGDEVCFWFCDFFFK